MRLWALRRSSSYCWRYSSPCSRKEKRREVKASRDHNHHTCR
jgi:hypothetical protein